MFNTLIVTPLYNLLIALYDIVPPHDFGIAIILTTIVIKVLMLHVSHVQIENQKKMQELQPEIKKLREKYKNDKQRQAQEMMALYKKHNTTPVAGCLPLIIQIVVFFAFYKILLDMKGAEIAVDTARLYSFVPNPTTISATLFSVDISVPSPLLAVLTAAAQYYQMKMMLAHYAPPSRQKPSDGDAPDIQDFAEILSKQMLYIAPGMMLIVGMTFPGGLTLYWLTSTVFTIAQQFFIMRKK